MISFLDMWNLFNSSLNETFSNSYYDGLTGFIQICDSRLQGRKEVVKELADTI